MRYSQYEEQMLRNVNRWQRNSCYSCWRYSFSSLFEAMVKIHALNDLSDWQHPARNNSMYWRARKNILFVTEILWKWQWKRPTTFYTICYRWLAKQVRHYAASWNSKSTFHVAIQYIAFLIWNQYARNEYFLCCSSVCACCNVQCLRLMVYTSLAAAAIQFSFAIQWQ